MNEADGRLLGLSATERKIVKALAGARLTVAELCEATALARTTLNYALRKLERRGWISADERDGARAWSLRDPVALKRRIASATDALLAGADRAASAAIAPRTKVDVYRGAAGINRLWHAMTAQKRARLYAIQPDASFALAVRHFLKELGEDALLSINERIKTGGIVVEGLVHERSADTIPAILRREDVDADAFINGFVGRLADTVRLPEGALDVPAEMYICGDVFAVISWKREFGVAITDAAIAAFFKELFGSLKYMCVRYDQNERMARRLVKTESA